jgi:hypothetical protein
MHMWHHVTSHLIISNDKDVNSENRIKLRVCDTQLSIALLRSLLVLLVVLCLLDLFGFPHPIRRLLAVPSVPQDSLLR